MDILEKYYDAFNGQNVAGMLGLLTDDVEHYPSQGELRKGKGSFEEFLNHMNNCYLEKVANLKTLYSTDGTFAAAEFDLDGKYLKTDGDFIPANGQTYKLRVGAFFDIENGKIKRVSNHYNLNKWLEQVGGK